MRRLQRTFLVNVGSGERTRPKLDNNCGGPWGTQNVRTNLDYDNAISILPVFCFLPHINFRMPEPIFMKLGTHIMATETISMACIINPSHQSVSPLCISFTSVQRNVSVNTFLRQRLHETIEEMLDASFSMRFMYYQKMWVCLYGCSVIWNESRRLGLPRTSCSFLFPFSWSMRIKCHNNICGFYFCFVEATVAPPFNIRLWARCSLSPFQMTYFAYIRLMAALSRELPVHIKAHTGIVHLLYAHRVRHSLCR
jgi:hypothetical protein